MVPKLCFWLVLSLPIRSESFLIHRPSWKNNCVSYSEKRNLIITHNTNKSYESDPHPNDIDYGDDDDEKRNKEGIRLNKVLKETHSRREADALIEGGRVTVNGKAIGSKGGFKVLPYVDSVELDGEVVTGWEEMNGLENRKGKSKPSTTYSSDHFEYIKYWKPTGVTCTTEKSVRSNIISEIRRDGYNPKHRVYPVGRLDKDTTGLIILTSDGRLPNSVLRGEAKQPKIYEVTVDRPVDSRDIDHLRRGVVITTVAMRDGRKAPPLTARTRPCEVKQLAQNKLQITLTEGRNRQVRKMLAALDYEVIRLHRSRFMGMGLAPLYGPGDWIALNREEMVLVENALKAADDNFSQNE